MAGYLRLMHVSYITGGRAACHDRRAAENGRRETKAQERTRKARQRGAEKNPW